MSRKRVYMIQAPIADFLIADWRLPKRHMPQVRSLNQTKSKEPISKTKPIGNGQSAIGNRQYLSLISQRHQRIDLRCSPRRDVRSNQGYEAEEQRNTHICQWISGADSI